MLIVYFIIEDPFSDRVKIGKTSNINTELCALQVGNPDNLIVYKIIYCDTEDDMNAIEDFLHNLLKARRINGEWFKLILDEIDTIHHSIMNIKYIAEYDGGYY